MKFGLILVAVVAAFAGILFFTSGNTKPTASLTFKTVAADVSHGGQLIDVRTPAEFASGHIAGAVNLSLQDMQINKLPAVAKTQPVYVYCHSGNRSGQATVILKAAGYRVIDLGAITHVESIGGALTTNPKG
ncbi:MAG: rhodanese-like domain-containing protein [Candidatus Saccharibacteria bacterium]